MADKRHESRQTNLTAQYRRRIEAMGGIVGVAKDCPPEIAEQFLKHVLDYELQGEGPPLLEHLQRMDVGVPAADDLDDHSLPVKLWEIIAALATLRVYLQSTDHLSDRQLYRYLREEMLMQPTAISDDPKSAWHFDVIGSGSAEDIDIYLRYYADDEERERWAVECPDMTIPEKAPRPFARDCRLPRRAWESG